MSIQHINAVRECTYPFKRLYTRQLLIWLADAAYTEEQVAKFGNGMRFGELWRDEQWMMNALDLDRRQTITDCLNELLEAGAIRRVRRQRRSTITFVDIEWLKNHKRPQVPSNEASEETATPGEASETTWSEASKAASDVAVHNSQRGVRVFRSSEVNRRSSGLLAIAIAPQVLPQAEAAATPKPKTRPAPVKKVFNPDEEESFTVEEIEAELESEGDGLSFAVEAVETEDALEAPKPKPAAPVPLAPVRLKRPEPTKEEKEADLYRRADELTAYIKKLEADRLAGYAEEGL